MTVGQINDVVKLLNTAGVLGMLIVIIYTGYKGVWVWGRSSTEKLDDLREQLNAQKQEVREWKELALRGTVIAEHVVRTRSARSGDGDGDP